jgi:hypothetical protein
MATPAPVPFCHFNIKCAPQAGKHQQNGTDKKGGKKYEIKIKVCTFRVAVGLMFTDHNLLAFIFPSLIWTSVNVPAVVHCAYQAPAVIV